MVKFFVAVQETVDKFEKPGQLFLVMATQRWVSVRERVTGEKVWVKRVWVRERGEMCACDGREKERERGARDKKTIGDDSRVMR